MTNINNDTDRAMKIESLRQTINSAEKTIQSAKAMLLQLEGKKKSGRKKKIESSEEEGTIIYGTFDGQIMIGDDGKQYPVPANYASKSKLIEGDMLKLTIDNGSFLYKQVGPIERKNLIGIAGQDESGNYFIIAEGIPYKVLLASITYFKISPGDEVVITIPAEGKSSWAAIENVLQKNEDDSSIGKIYTGESDVVESEEDTEKDEPDTLETSTEKQDDIINEWMSDIEEIKKEIQQEKIKAKSE